MKVILDAEFNGLEPTKLWCIVCKDIDTKKNYVFRYPFFDFISFCDEVEYFVGHNIIAFDSRHLNRLLDRTLIEWSDCIDTLVVSRLIHYAKEGGHSVENWGKGFGLTKKFINSWDDGSKIEEYIERCIYDVEIQYLIYKELERFIEDEDWHKALRVEHEMAQICMEMHDNGFSFDEKRAKELLSQIEKEMEELETEIKETVPPALIRDQPIQIKWNKDGTLSKRCFDSIGLLPSSCSAGDFWRFHYEPFNPASPKQRLELLNRSGWKPTEKTKSHLLCERELKRLHYKKNRVDECLHPKYDKLIKEQENRLEHFKVYGWKTNETNLDTLPPDAPRGASSLATWLTLEGRRGDLVEWLAAYNPNTGRIHGTFNGIGSWTHRMSHVRPNQGNIFSVFTPDQCKFLSPTGVEQVKLRYNGPLRACWKAAPRRWLVGTDAEGIQLRILAHLIDDKEFTRAIEEGSKHDGTDVHSFNRSILGEVCRSRDDAKTFIYAWLLGAGLAKVAEIFQCSQQQARVAMDLFLSRLPALGELKRDRIPADARRGFFDGIDGRKVICESSHLMLAGYLQNGEACVMKHANVLWKGWLEEEGIEYKQVDFVHDEWQTECMTEEDAHEVGRLQCKAIVETGEILGLNCKLAGEYKVGKNWLETH